MEHYCRIRLIQWQPRGKLLASVGGGGAILLWQPGTGEKANLLVGHPDEVTAIRWRPDGSLLASGDTEGRVYLWDPATKRAVDIKWAHDGRIDGLSWSLDGSKLLTVSGSEVKLWVPVKRPAASASGARFQFSR